MFRHIFHKAVANWFEKTFQSPTQVQELAWKSIKANKNTLIAAPTGSGKTLAAFLSAIDDLVLQGVAGNLPQGVQVVYVSPLKALSNDIERNLKVPLSGIAEELRNLNLEPVSIEAMVRTGDTPAADRTSMIRRPPHILVTTPESLYLLLTSVGGRKMLSSVHTLIIDEIHAMVGDKRGSHLTLSVERLEALTGRPLHRIGLSATQKPVELVARFLTGQNEEGEPACEIIDAGHSRRLDLGIEIPRSPLSSVMANEVWTEIYDILIRLIETHQTTLIFVNTRRLAERLSYNLNEILGPGYVLAHHGSMSREQRFNAEQKLKNGSLKALVATASLELGIDVGSIDLVCQIGSPRSITAFLQRVGRSGHSVNKIPKGRLFPLTLDELAECVAIIDAIKRRELDQVAIPEKPLDVLAQQIVAETSCKDYNADELFGLFTKAYPYRNLARKEFDEVIAMLTEGFVRRNGRHAAYLYHDEINGRLKARKGARLVAILSGGAIPDNFEFDVILEPENVFIGTVNEDFAIESIPGNIFKLGNNSWKIRRIEDGRVRVEDAAGQPPNIPFWLGEAPARTKELSAAVSRLREEISDKIDLPADFGRDETDTEEWKKRPLQFLVDEKGIDPGAAEQLIDYLAASKAALNAVPSQNTIVMERFFDEAGDMHLVIHSPFGNRINKAWGLALRKRFCRKFNFELQAAANDDSIILSLGPTHSFPLEEVYSYLKPSTVRNILIQAMLDAPVFEVRWRWNASRALAISRRRAGGRVPAQLQRMQSEDLVAQVFPDQLACLENISGDREIPDHPLVNQTIRDCLYEAMDIEGLENLLEKIDRKEVNLVARDLTEPSPLAQGILNARPYAFLDDAPVEERRTLAVRNRRWLSPAEASEIGRLDPGAIEAVRQEIWPQASIPDELHDTLMLSGFITMREGVENSWTTLFEELVSDGRAVAMNVDESHTLWIAAERAAWFKALYPGKFPEIAVPEKYKTVPEGKDPLTEIIRGRLEIKGPMTSEALSEIMRLNKADIDLALFNLESEGFAFRGYFTGATNLEWCERRSLSRIHRYTIRKLRSEIQPISPADFMRFLFVWHRMDSEEAAREPLALENALQKLEGYEAPAAAWEGDILPSRVSDYEHAWLDMLCISGKIAWGRFRVPSLEKDKKIATPIKTSPIALVNRANLESWKISGAPHESSLSLSPNAERALNALRLFGALFYNDIAEKTKLFQSQLDEALGELIGAGLATSDSFTGLRALLVPIKYKTNAGSKRDTGVFSMSYAGRWSLIRDHAGEKQQLSPEQMETIAWALLRRYGVVFRKLAERESLSPPWRDLVKLLRTMEARGQVRGGRFIEGVWGEQFALPEALVELRRVRKEEKSGKLISISAADPLNLTGIVTPGKRAPAHTGNRILYRDGSPVAVLEAKEIHFLIEPAKEEKWELQNRLIQRTISPQLRKYLGKGVY